MSYQRGGNALLGVLLLILALGTASEVTLAHVSNGAYGAQGAPAIGELQVRSSAVEIAALGSGGLNLTLKADTFNAYGFGATLEAMNYSIYVDGRYVGSGETSHQYYFAPRTSQTVYFPLHTGWSSALLTVGDYVAGLGSIDVRASGTARVGLGEGSIATLSFDIVL